MTEFLDAMLDALLDSLKVLALALVVYIVLSFIEDKIAKALKKESKVSPLIGALLGIIPQCGLTVVGSDLYQKKHITMGTLIALFIACSDEALPIFLSKGKDAINVLPIFAVKIVVGFVVGLFVDIISRKSHKEVEEHHDHCDHHLEEDVHVGCCHHDIEENEKESKLHHYFIHPLLHSLKIFAYVLVINILFATLIYFVGQDNLIAFLKSNKYIAPLIATIIGAIPNCAASVVISEVFLLGGISLGACISGLIMNAGLGLAFLFKNKNNLKNNLIIVAIMFLTSIITGYITCFIIGF